MKAPGKIYVTIDRPNERIEYNPELVGVAWSKKDKSCEHIEYIRKDLLLEWAKNELENARITDFDDFGRGEVITWEEIVDKLNSL